MPAVFKIVSRASGKALTALGLPEPTGITQLPAIDEYLRFQSWTLQPLDRAEDCLIRSFSAPALAIGLNPTDPQSHLLYVGPVDGAQVWRITPIASPPYFFLLEGSDDLLIDVPGGSHASNVQIQVSRRNEHTNQQWVFLPVLAELP
ncbi:MAG: RICIN domain-containing protein [Solirubrobacterales bacterium]|nr:RICIN domain-containing protein [Solirubrobacterales bacterium]